MISAIGHELLMIRLNEGQILRAHVWRAMFLMVFSLIGMYFNSCSTYSGKLWPLAIFLRKKIRLFLTRYDNCIYRVNTNINEVKNKHIPYLSVLRTAGKTSCEVV